VTANTTTDNFVGLYLRNWALAHILVCVYFFFTGVLYWAKFLTWQYPKFKPTANIN